MSRHLTIIKIVFVLLLFTSPSYASVTTLTAPQIAWLFPCALALLSIPYLLWSNQRLKKSTRQLKHSEQRFKSTIEGSGDTLWDWNIQSGEIIRINDKYNMNSAKQGNSIPNQNRIHPQDVHIVEKLLKQHFAEKTPFFEASYRIKDDLGQYHWVLDRGKIIEKDDNLNPLRMTGTVRDIGHFKNTEERLNLFAKCVESLTDAIAIYEKDYDK